MITQKRRFLYQPGTLTSIICWSWTLVIFFIGIITWLEITHFQWITLFFFLFFLLISWIEIHYRNIEIFNDQFIVSRVINPHWLTINLHDIQKIIVSKYRLGIIVNNKIYNFILPSNSVIEISNLIEETKNRV